MSSVQTTPMLPIKSHSRSNSLLLIEDSEDAMLMVEHALTDCGHGKYRLTWAKGLGEGLTELATKEFDLVLLDLGLPESAGSATHAWVSQCSHDAPVLVLTGDDSTETRDGVLAAGAADFLLKQNASGSELVQRVEALLSGRARQSIAAFASKRRRVLLVEDDEDAMLIVSFALQEYGADRFELIWAKDLKSGIDSLASGADIVLLDLGLPDNSGVMAYQQIRQIAPKTPMVVLTANDCPETEFALLASGANDYLEKRLTSGPFLIQSIEAALSAKNRRKKKVFPC